MCEKLEVSNKKPLFETDEYRVVTDKYNWVLQMKTINKKTGETTWGRSKFYSSIKSLLKAMNEKKIHDNYDNVLIILEWQEQLNSIVEKINNIIIKNNIPTIIKEKVIEKKITKFIKPDKRRSDGGKVVKKEIEETIIKNEVDSEKIDNGDLW